MQPAVAGAQDQHPYQRKQMAAGTAMLHMHSSSIAGAVLREWFWIGS